ncbi:tetratricopeptide repeat protein [Myroides sp. C15-4]|uniref:tetratricopeptide repeat protein n=1 Tax=Myroides sp. C15-4 TaxID=3400532 RepID=UPI003D2F8B5A
MRKITIALSFVFTAALTMVSCVDNPYVTEDNYLNKPNAGHSWVIGLQKQLALTTNIVVINAEITSDNYFNNYTQYSKVFDQPQIDYFDPDVNNLQASIQALREMAVYGLEVVLPKDPTLTKEQVAFMHFCKGYAQLLGGEFFLGLPESNLGKISTTTDMLNKAVESFALAYEMETKEEVKNAYALFMARAHYRLGNKAQAKQYAEIAITMPTLLYTIQFDGKNNVPNEMQNATYDALPNRLAPLPRLDYLDPKFFAVGTPQNDQKELALAKAEEGYLILAEWALATQDLAGSKQYLYELLEVVAARPTELVDDKKETRNGGIRSDYPLKEVGVRFDATAPEKQGYVLDRQKGKVLVSKVSGTKVTQADIESLTSTDELLYIIYLLRQEIFISEGRRLTDLGIKYPISQIEEGNNPYVTAAYTKALIPDFIPLQAGMDDFTTDPVTGVVTMKYDMNKVLVAHKNSPYIMPLVK